jgi:hypothetical protein
VLRPGEENVRSLYGPALAKDCTLEYKVGEELISLPANRGG